MDIMNKIEELMQDKEFVAQLAAMETVEEMTEALNARGVEITVEQMEQSLELAIKREQAQGDELNENDLEDVSGGGITAIIVGGILIWTAVSIVCGALAGLTSRCKRR